MNELVITPGNPHDFAGDELDSLAETLRGSAPSFNVRVIAKPERGYGVTPYEVITIIATVGGAGAAIKESIQAARAAARWARERWQRDRNEHPIERPRPRMVVLYGPDGRVLAEVLIDLPEGEPTETPPEDPTGSSP
jgi:hypothetical protein